MIQQSNSWTYTRKSCQFKDNALLVKMLRCGSNLNVHYQVTKEDVVHIHNGILLSHKKSEMMPFAATWMDLQMIIEVKSVDRETQLSYDTANM